MENETITIAFNGENFVDDKWSELFNDSKTIVKSLSYEPTHAEISCSKSGKILTLKRSEKKILNYLQSGEKIEYFTLYSLPEKFDCAAFDYNVFISCDKDLMSITMNKSIYDEGKKESILNIFVKYMNSGFYEVYEMDRMESPFIYAVKANPKSSFKSLSIIENGRI